MVLVFPTSMNVFLLFQWNTESTGKRFFCSSTIFFLPLKKKTNKGEKFEVNVSFQNTKRELSSSLLSFWYEYHGKAKRSLRGVVAMMDLLCTLGKKSSSCKIAAELYSKKPLWLLLLSLSAQFLCLLFHLQSAGDFSKSCPASSCLLTR